MRVKITSDGTSLHTKVETEDGREIKGVNKIEWSLRGGGIAQCRLYLHDAGMAVIGQLEEVIPIVQMCPNCDEVLVPGNWETEEGDWVRVWLCACEGTAPEESP